MNLAMESSKGMQVELKYDDMGPIWQNASWGHRPTINTSQELLPTSRTQSWCVGTGSNPGTRIQEHGHAQIESRSKRQQWKRS